MLYSPIHEHEYMLFNHIRKDVLIVALVKYICDLSGDLQLTAYTKIINFLIKNNIINKNICNETYNTIKDGIQQNLILLFNNYIKSIPDYDIDIILPKLPKSSYNNLIIKDKIGAGSESIVYKVKHCLDKNMYAMKITEYEFLSKWDIEISILSKLTHDNIVRYYNSWIDLDFRNKKDKKYLYTLTELCDDTLYNYMKENEFTYEQKINILIQILSGLEFLHKNNIIHRDIKLSNILVKKKDNTLCIKISDFGCSKIMDGEILTPIPSENDLGTFFYISPELLNNCEYDETTDVYSFGILLYVFMSNFKTQSEEINKLQNFTKSEISIPDTNNKELIIDIIKKCTTKNKEERPSVRKIIETLSSFISVV